MLLTLHLNNEGTYIQSIYRQHLKAYWSEQRRVLLKDSERGDSTSKADLVLLMHEKRLNYCHDYAVHEKQWFSTSEVSNNLWRFSYRETTGGGHRLARGN